MNQAQLKKMCRVLGGETTYQDMQSSVKAEQENEELVLVMSQPRRPDWMEGGWKTNRSRK